MNKPTKRPHHLALVASDTPPDDYRGTGLPINSAEPPLPEEVQAMLEAAAWELQAVAGAAELCSHSHVQAISTLVDTVATVISTIADALDNSNGALELGGVDPLHAPVLVVGTSQHDLRSTLDDLSQELSRLTKLAQDQGFR